MANYEVGRYLTVYSSDEPRSEVEQALIVRVEYNVTYVTTAGGVYTTFKSIDFDSSLVNEDGTPLVEHQFPRKMV
jgi:hypothetical protein